MKSNDNKMKGIALINKVTLNDDIILAVKKDQTILEAALDKGLNFPYLCKVGGCGKCKAQLVKGSALNPPVTSWALSQDEIDRGYVLACQTKLTNDAKLVISSDLSTENYEESNFTSTHQNLSSSHRDRNVAGFRDYCKFWFFHFFGIISAILILAGGKTATLGFFSILIILSIGDYFSGEDLSWPKYKYHKFLTMTLWMSLPILSIIVLSSLWTLSPGDPWAIGSTLTKIFGLDFLLFKSQTTGIHAFSTFCLTGLMIGMIGTIPAHELTHRTWDMRSTIIGRWLLAFSLDTSFSIEHIYGHHRYVSTQYDPATAPRGRSVYRHILVSTLKGNISAWKIESKRLRDNNLGLFSQHNRFIRGVLMSFTLALLAFTLGGLVGVLYFIGMALFGKAMLEIVNYMEHYGMVRDPKLPVMPRHSWNTNSRLSSWSTFNLSRHSHHHADGEVPFHDLSPKGDAPVMIGGYLSTMFITLIPPLWYKVMTLKLKDWDENFASEREKVLISQQSPN